MNHCEEMVRIRSEEQIQIIEEQRNSKPKKELLFQVYDVLQNEGNMTPVQIGVSIIILTLILWMLFGNFLQQLLNFRLSYTYYEPTVAIPIPNHPFNFSKVSQKQKYLFQQAIASLIEPFNDTDCRLINVGGSVLCQNVIKKSIALLNIGAESQDLFGCALSDKYQITNYFYGCGNQHTHLCSSLPKQFESLDCIGQISESIGAKTYRSFVDILVDNKLKEQPRILKMVVDKNWDSFISLPINKFLDNFNQMVLQFHIESAQHWGVLDIFRSFDRYFYPINTHMNNLYCYQDSFIQGKVRKIQSSVFQVTYVRKTFIQLRSETRSFKVAGINSKRGPGTDCQMPLPISDVFPSPIQTILIPQVQINLHSLQKQHLHLKNVYTVPTMGVPASGDLFNDIVLTKEQRQHYHTYVASVFKPFNDTDCQFQRYGSDDRGFVICRNLVQSSTALVSAGIEEKDRFGCELTSNFTMPNYQFGCLVREEPFCRTNNKANFFQEGCLNERSQYLQQGGRYFYSLKDMIDSRKLQEKHIILKLDSEGSQWSALRSLPLSYLPFIDQLVMKVHLNQGVYLQGNINILKSLQEYFIPVDLHMNNLGCSNQGLLPSSIFEVTLVNNNLIQVKSQSRSFSPNKLSRVSSSTAKDCQIQISKVDSVFV